MTDRRLFLVILLALPFLMTGCVETVLKVTNHTGAEIQFTTAHTGKTYTIPQAATREVPHTVGTVSISRPGQGGWNYETISVPDLSDQTIKGMQRLTLPVSVEPDGMIVLPSGRKLAPREKPKSSE